MSLIETTLKNAVDMLEKVIVSRNETIAKLMRERDEARRMYCLAVSENDKQTSAEDIADKQGWTYCFADE